MGDDASVGLYWSFLRVFYLVVKFSSGIAVLKGMSSWLDNGNR